MQRPFEIDSAIYPFESRWTQVDGINVHYIDEGPRDGGEETVVCFHGNPAWSLLYAPVIAGLRLRRRCIAIDMPGFGMSDAPHPDRYSYSPADHSRVLRQVLDGLGLNSYSIFIQDWGGPIGLATVADAPEKVRRIFLGNTWGWQYDPATEMGKAAQEFSGKNGTDEARAENLEKNTIPKLSLPLLLRGIKKRNPDLRGATKSAYMAPFERPDGRYGSHWFPRYIMQSEEFFADLARKLPALFAKPAILFWAEKDPIFTARVREEWESRLSNYRLVLLPEASHFFQDEEPEAIIAAIEA